MEVKSMVDETKSIGKLPKTPHPVISKEENLSLLKLDVIKIAKKISRDL